MSLDQDIGTLKKVNNFYWPEKDIDCQAVVFNTTKDIDKAMKYVKDTKCVIQAGGNCGVWPKYLAGKFDNVYTFEPDATNFHCLCLNVTEPNVYKFQAALGIQGGQINLEGDVKNCGAHFVSPNERGAAIPMVRLDDLNLSPDLVILDIEGYELNALKGAILTLIRHKPVLQLENKGLSDKYGTTAEDLERFLEAQDFEIVDKVHRDIIACHKSLL